MRNLLALALLIASPAAAQVTATLPVTCNPAGTICQQATAVTNPDGTNVGAGGGSYNGPVAAQLPASLGAKSGAASLSVVPNTDTAFPVSSATLATAANQATMIANQTATGSSAQNVQGNVASGSTDSGNAVKAGGVVSLATGTLSALTTGNRADLTTDIYGNLRSVIAGVVGTPTDGGTQVSYVTQNNKPAAFGGPLAIQGFVWNGSSSSMARGDTTGAWVGGHSSIATAQVSVTTSATLVAAARAGRQKIILTVGAANTCAFGNTGVTATTGFPLAPTVGASLTLDTAAAVYAVCSATTTVSAVEEF